jgi:RNA polymerase sigma-B factor
MPTMVHNSPVLGEVSADELSDRLVVEHLELARKLAYRYAGRGEPVEELVQVAMLGLVQAAKRYDPDRGNGFVPYAVPTILGEIRRYFRDQCWAVRVPRPLHDLYRDILTARDRLSAVLERSPTPAELAEELEVTQDEILRALECGTAYGAASLDAPEAGASASEDGGRTLGETIGSEDDELDVVEQREAVRDILNQLPERERRIIVLRYFGERTQAQIADELGISQMHVSRLLSSTIDRIRSAIQSDTPQPLHWPTPRNRAA